MDNVEDVVGELGVEDLGHYDGDMFLIELNSSDEYSSLYSEISTKFNTETSMSSFEDARSVTVFTNDSVEITATADYDNDLYSILIGRK